MFCDSAGGSRGKAIGWSRLGWASLLLTAPGPLIRLAGGHPDRRACTVARILGARHAAQGVAEVLFWPRGRRLGALVDVSHGLTAFGLAVADDRWRRVGITDGVLACSLAVIGLRGAH